MNDICELFWPKLDFRHLFYKTAFPEVLKVNNLLREQLTHISEATDEKKATLEMTPQKIWFVGAKKLCYYVEFLVIMSRLHLVSPHA